MDDFQNGFQAQGLSLKTVLKIIHLISGAALQAQAPRH